MCAIEARRLPRLGPWAALTVALLAPGALTAEALPQGAPAPLQLTSPAFEDGATIPRRFTCDGANVSPPLQVQGVPAGTQSLALVVDDPDAPHGPFVHWVLWNLRPETRQLPEGITATTSGPFAQGTNGAHRQGYLGPCPPHGTHRYRFVLYALDAPLTLPPGAFRPTLQKALAGHVLARTTLTGLYAR